MPAIIKYSRYVSHKLIKAKEELNPSISKLADIGIISF